MPLFVVGLNHLTAPLAIREQVAFMPEQAMPALEELVMKSGVREVAAVSTCNRTEVYAIAAHPGCLIEWLARRQSVAELSPYLYVHEGRPAVRHLFRVASGLDSAVLGEAQILGQIKDAFELAQLAGSVGTLLNGLFQRAFAAAKAVRTQTELGAHSVSMAAASVRVAEQFFSSLDDRKVLFIGAGDMVELCAAHYHGQRPARIAIANRSRERGMALAQRLGASYLPLESISSELPQFDIVLASTASPLPILGKGMVERALRARVARPVLFFDLAVPRDIEPEVAELDGVRLFTVDDLAQIVQEGRDRRQAEALAAERIIEGHVDDFETWLSAREIVPVIRGLRDQVERIRRHELDRARKLVARGEDPARILEMLSHALVGKFLHHPTQALQHASELDRPALADLVRRLYNLEANDS